MKILVIDPDQTMVIGLGNVLKKEGCLVDHAKTGEEGVEFHHVYDYDIVALEMVLSDGDGLSILYKIRSGGKKIPVMIVSSLSDVSAKVEALNLGADDYLCKPFDLREFLARAQAVVRRSQGHSASAISIGPLKIDLRRNIAEVNGEVLSLTSKEYSILELLAIRKGVMISKGLLFNHLYGGMDEPEIKIVDVFMCRLRKKIASLTGIENFIQTVWGRGYILQDPADTYQRVG